MRNSIVNKIIEYAEQDESVFLITGDAGYGVLDEYQKRFPRRYRNLGVAEQNMIGFAAGLAMTGSKVFVYNIIPFLLYRCYEQVRNDICYQRLSVVLIGIGSGVTYAPGGMTHYSVEDIGIARTLPNLRIFSPSDPLEARCATEFAFAIDEPVYIRIAKSGEPSIHEGKIEDISKPLLINKGSQIAVLFHGSISQEVVQALKDLPEPVVAISVPMIQPLNFKVLKQYLSDVHTIITVEEHFIEGGLGSIVGEWILRERLSFRLKKLGIRNEFIHAVRKTKEMRQLYGIDAQHIRDVVKKAAKNG